MLRYLCIILILILCGKAHSQNYSWITPNKVYLKMSVADDGIYRISQADFNSAGINTSVIDPRTVKVYNKGNQIPIYFEGESDGVFNPADYLDFYGTRNYGGPQKVYDENNNLKYISNEYFDFYTDTNAYWIDWNGSNGLRMGISNYSTLNPNPGLFQNELLRFEKDKMYWIGELFNGSDYRNFTNEKFLGENWYYGIYSNQQSLIDTFSLPLLYPSPQNATVRIKAYPQNVSLTIQDEHKIEIKVNGNLISTILVNDSKLIDSVFTFSSSLLSNSSVNYVSATYSANGGFNGFMFIDYMEISYPKQYKFRNNQTVIKSGQTDTSSYLYKLNLYVPGNPIYIYDIKNGIRINAYSNNSDTLKFTGKLSGNFEVINKNITKKPLRIVQRQVPDYVSSSNRADYLLIYNTLFESQAGQLKNFRESQDNFRVTKAEIHDLYDIFNYGIEDPVAIRNFTRHVYNNWELPKVRYICLFGRGSLDPKGNSPTTQFRNNYIPVFGNPSSDNYYANINTDGFAYYSMISIGRLPANSVTEAQYMVDNIVTYETQKPASWDKSFTFIGGGANASEQTIFLRLIDTLINPFILPSPLSGNPVRINRDDLNGGQTFNYADSIKNQINRGTSTVNFMGHAGSQDWEIGMTDPSVLSNYNGKFPLIFSMTCYTGKVGEPTSRSFGERFLNMQNKGAIGYLGTSGWGFVYAGSQLNENLYKAIATDSIRRIGDIVSSAMNFIKKDSSVFSSRHTLNCYTLQGDPAVKLLIPKIPEYSISENDYAISNKTPAVYETVTFKAYPKNFGTFSDSCKVRFQITSSTENPVIRDTTIRNFRFSDSIKFIFNLKKAGLYNVSVNLDPDNLNPNENRADNTLSVNIQTKEAAFVMLKPINNSFVKKDTIDFTILNPFKYYEKATLFMEFDTTSNFNSPLKRTFIQKNISGVTTSFKTTLLSTDTNKISYWRINYSVGNDTAGWSDYIAVRYNPNLPGNINETVKDEGLKQVTLYLNNKSQYSESDLNYTVNTNEGIKLYEFTGNLYVRSLGSNGAEASFFSVLDKSIHIDAGSNTGLNLLKVRKLDGKILKHMNFKVTTSQSSDSVLNFLNTFDSTQYLMGLNAAYVAGGRPLSANLIAKFNQFGSTKIQMFRVGFFDSWSFIGYLNAPQSEVSEDVHPYNNNWIQSVSSMNRNFKSTGGTVKYSVGPANTWSSFSWTNIIPQGSGISFNVYGVSKNNSYKLFYENITSNNFTDLTAIDATKYPKLELRAKLNIDTIGGFQSPVLNSFRINYTLPIELVTESNSISQSDTAIYAGEEIKFKFMYHNSGFMDAKGTVVNIYKSFVAGENLIKSDTIDTILQPDSIAYYYGKFIVPYVRGPGSTALFILEVQPKNKQNEFYTFNNLNYFDVFVKLKYDNIPVEIYSDGHIVNNGDYVSLKPEFRINVKTGSSESEKINFSDSTEVSFVLNDKYIPFIINGKENLKLKKVSEQNDNNSELMRSFILLPELLNGSNNLVIKYRNNSGGFDTTSYDFSVSDELLVKDLYNYPNPMKGETQFIFNLLGSEIPSVCKIKIYTVTGRLIKEINYVPTIGYNQIPWDGRDNDGDIIANGTYLYKFVADDGVNKETSIQKLVVLR